MQKNKDIKNKDIKNRDIKKRQPTKQQYIKMNCRVKGIKEFEKALENILENTCGIDAHSFERERIELRLPALALKEPKNLSKERPLR